MCMVAGCDCELVKSYDQLTRGGRTTVLYVDSLDSICTQTSGPYARNCVEREETSPNGGTVVYRCVFCHRSDFDYYCKGITSTGKGCKNAGNYNGYCSKHSDQNHGSRRLFSIDQLEDWLSAYERRTVAEWKIRLHKKLEEIERLADMPLKALLSQTPPTYVYFIECDGYVKIGRSKRPDSRFKSLINKSDPTLKPASIDMANAKLLGYIPGSEDMESVYHWLLRAHRAEGEWFKFNSHVAKIIDYSLNPEGEFTIAGVYALVGEESASILEDSKAILDKPLLADLKEPNLEEELESVIPFEERWERDERRRARRHWR